MDIEGGWVTTREASEYLAVSKTQIRRLFLAGKLRRLDPDEFDPLHRAYYSWKDVLEIRFESNRAKKRLWLQKILNVDIPTDWITPREAAAILDVDISSIYKKIKNSTFLYAVTGNGTKLKRLLLPKRMVLKHLDDAERIKNRKQYSRYQSTYHAPRPALTPGEEAEFEEKKWLSAGEAARILRVTHANLCKFCKTKRLRSWPPPSWWHDARKWCFMYSDVMALRDDPVRLANRARWEKAFSKEAIGQRLEKRMDAVMERFPENPIKLDRMFPSPEVW